MEFDSAVVAGKAIGGLVGLPWLIVIGFFVARRPLFARSSIGTIIVGSLAAVGSVALWYVFVESEFGTTLKLNDALAAILTMLISTLVFRMIRRAKDKSRTQIQPEDEHAPNP